MGVLTVGLLAMFALVGLVFLILACSGGGRPKPPATPAFCVPNTAWQRPENMQFRNTQPATDGVHQMPSAVAAWPSMWVGPAPVAAPDPVVVDAVPALVQRRQPSASALRLISHRTAS